VKKGLEIKPIQRIFPMKNKGDDPQLKPILKDYLSREIVQEVNNTNLLWYNMVSSICVN
jgi:hypothetical protein